MELDGYVETGASLGNAAFTPRSFNRTRIGAGVEVAGRFGGLLPTARIGYLSEDESDEVMQVRLASAEHLIANQTLTIKGLDQEYAVAEAGLSGMVGGYGWRGAVEGRFTDETSVRATVTVSRSF